MKLYVFIVAVVAILLFETASSELSSDVKDHINNGINAANTLSTIIHDRNFTGTLTKITGLVSPFLGALGPIVGLILGFFGTSESAELQYMKQMMKHIDQRFDRVDDKLTEIGRKIDFASTKVTFGPIENNIHLVFVKLQELYQAPHTSVNGAKSEFIKTYEAKGIGNAQNIYDGLMLSTNIFSENLGDAVMKYTENDRKQCQNFMLGLLNLLLNAVKAEISYYKAVGQNDAYVKSQSDKWAHQIKLFSNKINSVDRTVQAKYLEQSNKEIAKFAKDQSKRSNQDLANFLNGHLTTKYFWRDWLVLVYNPVAGFDKHTMRTCHGWGEFRYYGHNVIVTSQNKATHASTVNQRGADLNVPTQDRHEHHIRFRVTYSYTDKHADQIYNSFSASIREHCSPYAYLGVITDKAALAHAYTGSSSRLSILHKHAFQLIAFG